MMMRDEATLDRIYREAWINRLQDLRDRLEDRDVMTVEETEEVFQLLADGEDDDQALEDAYRIMITAKRRNRRPERNR